MMIIRAVRLKDGKKNSFIVSLVLGIVTLVLAAVVFVHPAIFADLMMQLTGAAMATNVIEALTEKSGLDINVEVTTT